MPEDDRDLLGEFSLQVLRLLELHQRTHVLFDRAALPELLKQIELVRALALAYSLPLIVPPLPEVLT